MSKLPQIKAKEVARILEKIGFKFVRQKGSHKIFIKENLAITVPFHTKPLKKGTLFQIIKQTGLSTEEFVDLK